LHPSLAGLVFHNAYREKVKTTRICLGLRLWRPEKTYSMTAAGKLAAQRCHWVQVPVQFRTDKRDMHQWFSPQ
jgi:hypothetical protein